LQSQLIKDFGGMEGTVDIRGRGNYACRLNTQISCDIGPCVFGVKCSMKEEGGCFYFDQLNKVYRAKIVITNYAYWMSQNEYSEGLGDFQMLVLDEAHSSPDHVINHTSVSFNKDFRFERELLRLDGSLPNDPNTWAHWASERLTEAKAELEHAKAERKEKKYLLLKRLVEKLTRLEDRMDTTWVWEDTRKSVVLSPVWPAPYTEVLLFLGIPKIIFTSATVVPKTANLLGVDSSNMKHEEYPHSFPVESRPLTHLPTVQMNYKIGEIENRLWVNKVDQIIRDRVGTKGIIHTVSYARRDLIIERSKYSDHMITHQRKDTESVVRTFKRADPPMILVSPSMATGWDFPDAECRWQIIVKLPFPDTQGNIIKSRSKADPDFTSYITMQQLIQAVGRGVRNETDWAETFIIDNNITWFIDRYKHLSVDWFADSYRKRATIPPPLTGGYYE
ncbi:hypothetical protein KAR91_42390, partial [Candidatus Pacearchaeota archaeon]|nr:hypothetical protein [Candidatus Pacearchaeota archaeon]